MLIVMDRHHTWFTEDWSCSTIIHRHLQGMSRLAARNSLRSVTLCYFALSLENVWQWQYHLKDLFRGRMLSSEKSAPWSLNDGYSAGRITDWGKYLPLCFWGNENKDQEYTEHAVNFKADCIHISNVNMNRTVMYIVVIN